MAKGPAFSASFQEVSGLSWEMDINAVDNSGNGLLTPGCVRYGALILKRPLGMQSDSFTKWLDDCQKYGSASKKSDDAKALKTYDVVIHLLNESSDPIASWKCTNAFPKKWSLSMLDSLKSELATETIELAYAGIERLK